MTVRLCLAAAICAAWAAPAAGQPGGKTARQWADILRDEKNPRKRYAAVIALGRIGTLQKPAVPALIRAARQDKDARIRSKAIAALGGIRLEDPDNAIEAIGEALTKDKDVRVRRTAAVTLRLYGNRGALALESLEEALKDNDAQVRATSAEVLAPFGNEAVSAAPRLVGLLKDKDAKVRTAAAFALGRVTDNVGLAAGPLAAAVTAKSSSPELRRAAARSLGLYGEAAAPAAAPALAAALADGDVGLRREAILSLTKMGASAAAAESALRRALAKDADAQVRAFAAHALVEILGDRAESVVPALAERLKAEADGTVRLRLIGELGALGLRAAAAADALRAAAKDPQPAIRRAATKALLAVKGM